VFDENIKNLILKKQKNEKNRKDRKKADKVSSVTYPEIWRSPYGDSASPAGDAAFP